MQETIIFAPGASGTELLRSLTRFGQNTIGVRIVGPVELSRIALMRSGIAVTSTFLPRKDEPSVIDSFLREIPYFQNASFADSESMAAALYTLRSLIPDNEAVIIHEKLPTGEFPKKNEALIDVYDRYTAMLSETGRIDTIGLIRKALKEARILECDFVTLKEYPLTPLERTLAEKLSGEKIREVSITELLRAEPKPLHSVEFSECYGSSNEVRDVISFIYQNGIPLDHCTVAVTETLGYAELFHDLSTEYDIPMSFGCGLPITVSNPARLLKLYHDWNTSGFRGIDALSSLIMSSAFDRKRLQDALPDGKPISRDDWKKIIKAAGSLRLSANATDNRQKLTDYSSAIESSEYRKETQKADALYVLSCIRILSREMEKGPAYLIRTYSKLRNEAVGRFDRSAVTVIADMIDAYLQFSGKDDIDEIIPAILKKSVSSENSRQGHLHICGINGAMAVPREYLFIAGLSASNIPGSPTENYLLLDSDLRLFGEEPQIPTSTVRVLRKKQSLDSLLKIAAALNLKVRLSYSSYDLAALKEENPSSVLQQIIDEMRPAGKREDFEHVFRHTAFFEDRISKHYAVGNAYKDGKSILSDTVPPSESAAVGEEVEGTWSPTAIDVFFSCPRRFFLTQIMGIEEPEKDDPFEVISAVDLGKLAHSMMEQLGRERFQKDLFLERAAEAFDQFLISRPPVHHEDAWREKERFLRMMKNAFETDPGMEILASEEKKTVTHPVGITLRGIPDRVEKTSDGRYLIVDYKTGKRIRHQADDISTCLQVLIYAYMMEQSGCDIAGCEYRYIRSRKTVKCRYDEEMKEKLTTRLTEFRNGLLAGDYPCTAAEENCRYCTLRSVCGKDREVEKEEEGSDE